MPDGLMARLWSGLLATSPLEALAVLSSLVYVVLAVPRSRWCWIAGGVGSLIYVWLFARAPCRCSRHQLTSDTIVLLSCY